jgi:hypothetical protein
MRGNFVSVLARSLAACVLLFLVLGSLTGAGATGEGEKEKAKQGGSPQTNYTLWVIPHTHWEGAVFKTREEYLEIGLPHILKALYLLQNYPDYRFVLDQVAYVKAVSREVSRRGSHFSQICRGRQA